jgi:peptidoglycan hydrolase-like protein with peptidoglycan-binding domain
MPSLRDYINIVEVANSYPPLKIGDRDPANPDFIIKSAMVDPAGNVLRSPNGSIRSVVYARAPANAPAARAPANAPATGAPVEPPPLPAGQTFNPNRNDGGTAYQPGEREYAQQAAAQGNLAQARDMENLDLSKSNTTPSGVKVTVTPGSTAPSGQTTPAPAVAFPVAAPVAAQPAAPVAAQPAAPKQWNTGVLGAGSKGTEVEALQKKLGIAADGSYGSATRDAVIALQKKLGVTADGAYGPQTKAAHDKMRSGSGAMPATSQAAPDQVTQTQQTFNTTQGVAQGRINPNSLRGQTTTATPQVAPPAGNPSGVGKNAAYTSAQITTAKELLADPQVSPRDKAWAQGVVNSAVPQPVREMSKSDDVLLDKMLTIANLR